MEENYMSVYAVPHFIDGQTIEALTRKLDIYNPATGTVIGQVGAADKAIVDQAVIAAKTAFITWSTTTASQRAKILFRFKMLLDKNLDDLARIVTREHGKTWSESKASILRGIDVVDYACAIPNHLKGSYADNVANGVDCYSLYQPLGICAGITPFNFPAMIPLWMFPMAIACGNTFILKPSEKDPSCAIRLVELAHEAGLPNGVVNVVQGDKETVDALLTHPDIQAVSFVGSSMVAKHIQHSAIANNKRVQAFGGAKNHCIVMPDADLDEAASVLTVSAYGCAGERCMAISVVVAVGDQVADQLGEKLMAEIKKIKIGAGDLADSDMGPVITPEHFDRVQSYISLGKQEGAQLVIDGSQYKYQYKTNGFFIGPCLFDHVKPSMRIYREEIFGPVLCLVRVNNFDEALQLINSHDYANGTAIFTRDGYAARTFAEKIQVGMVGINVPIPVPVAYQSFGGWKQSVFSDIGMYGMESVRFYTKLKTITERWSKGVQTWPF
jgi:malonate-semialdehyde dehydrogenase (acetylating)/methylmalonate-semialdehyde dehydrogenase